MMNITIHQPEYMPWVGFFGRILSVDIFVILDDVGYQKNAFINRNRIRTKNGIKWITVPVKGRSPNKKINEVEIDNSTNWRQKHLSEIKLNYEKSPYFLEIYTIIEDALSRDWAKITDLDIYLIKKILEYLDVNVKIEKSSSLNIEGKSTVRLVNICKKLDADCYISGQGAKKYIDLELFKENKISVDFQRASYQELSLSVIDLLFNNGKRSLEIIRYPEKKI